MPLDGPIKSDVPLTQRCEMRLNQMRDYRMSYWLSWAELAGYLLPRRYRWLATAADQATRGTPLNQRILDGTGSLAVRTLASGMMAGITSPARPWFRLTLEDQDLAEFTPVKLWLDTVQKRMMRVFAESNFYTSMATLYEDLAVFGTGAMMCYEDYDDVVRFYNSALGEYYLGQSDRLEVDTFYREFNFTALQSMQRWGWKNLSSSLQGQINTPGGGDQEFIIAHAVEPDLDGITGLPFREIYWERGVGQQSKPAGNPLAVNGFHEFPVIAARWNIVANDPYGRSPGMDAIGDVKQLQVMTKRLGQAIDKMVNPPLLADPVLRNEPATVMPGGITYVPLTAQTVGLKPVYEVPPQTLNLMQNIEKVSGRIKETFFVDLFLMIAQLDTVRTATEIIARKEEKLLMLGPVLERFENEALDPVVERTFNIMARASLPFWRGQAMKGMLPPPPPELRKQTLKVEYTSMLADAQRAAKLTGMERQASMVGRISAQVPDALDTMDWDEFITEYNDGLGNTPKFMRSAAAIAQIRQAKAKAAAAQAALTGGTQIADGAKTLSETDVGGGQNALSAMLGGGPSQEAA